MRERGSTHRIGGFSLLEVAVAMAIMAVGLTGVSALLIRAVVGTEFSAHRATATWLSQSLAEQMQLVPQGIGALLSAPSADSDTDCSPAHPCAPGAFAQHSYLRWQSTVRDALPAGSGHLCRDSSADDGNATDPACDGSGPWVVKLFWNEARANSDGAARHVRVLGA